MKKLDAICRCGHARRFHRSGNIAESWSTACYRAHPRDETPADYGSDCYYFEAVDGWQEALADNLRAEGYVVLRPNRDALGRFKEWDVEAERELDHLRVPGGFVPEDMGTGWSQRSETPVRLPKEARP